MTWNGEPIQYEMKVSENSTCAVCSGKFIQMLNISVFMMMMDPELEIEVVEDWRTAAIMYQNRGEIAVPLQPHLDALVVNRVRLFSLYSIEFTFAERREGGVRVQFGK